VFLNATAFAQSLVRGTVRDGDANTLSGATVSAVGSTMKVLTNGAGNFAITVPAGVTQLSFSYIILETQTVLINNRTQINISLAGGIDLDVVTVVGYGSVKKK
jgi:hypothetical protein